MTRIKGISVLLLETPLTRSKCISPYTHAQHLTRTSRTFYTFAVTQTTRNTPSESPHTLCVRDNLQCTTTFQLQEFLVQNLEECDVQSTPPPPLSMKIVREVGTSGLSWSLVLYLLPENENLARLRDFGFELVLSTPLPS